jgi:hypothetical protein
MAVSVPPTPWAVVPPGTGTLNIMIANVKAAKIESRGTVRPLSRVRVLLAATAQNGVAAA